MEDVCVDSKINKLQFDTLKEGQKDLYTKQNEQDVRIVVLEKNSLLMTSEFANLKQNLDKQSILMLELDSKSTDKNDKMFDKILVSQAKIEEKNADKFDKIQTGQDAIIKTLSEVQANNKGKVEITKTKLVVLGTLFVALITILPMLIALI